MNLLDLLTVVVLLVVGGRLLSALRYVGRSHVRRRIVELVTGLRPRHFLLALPVLAGVGTAAVALIQVPGLDFGWWTAIGGVGNPVFGGTERTVGTPLEVVVPIVFLALLLPTLPIFVEGEERVFRLGAEGWSLGRRLWQGVRFGLVHALVGIPVGVALALSLGGWYFTWAYLRGFHRGGRAAALLESTCSHLAYNLTVIGLVVLGLALGA